MALSCYSAPGELDYPNSDLASIFAGPDDYNLLDILGLSNHCSFSDSFCNSIVDVEVVGNGNGNENDGDFFLPSYPEQQQVQGALFPPIVPVNDSPVAKRHKVYEEWYDNGGMLQDLCDGLGFVDPNPPPSLEFLSPFGGSGFNISGGCGGGMEVQKCGGGGGSGSGGGGGGEKLSSQSVAARQRRRKITEKTQELGKLIPGGQKMNTAEMFQAAYKYITFLQAQVGVLESMASANQGDGESIYCEELSPLLGSPVIQEKLYSMEKCLVPGKFAESIVRENKVQPNRRAMKEGTHWRRLS